MPETKSIVDDFFKLIEIEKQLKKVRIVRGKTNQNVFYVKIKTNVTDCVASMNTVAKS